MYLIFLLLGTALLLDACIDANVGLVITCSTQDTAVDLTDQIMIDETYKVEPCNLAFGDYARTKFEAEQIVLEKNGSCLKNGIDIFNDRIIPTGISKNKTSFCYCVCDQENIFMAFHTLKFDDDKKNFESFFLCIILVNVYHVSS